MQQTAINNKVEWERTYSGLYDEMVEIRTFFNAHAPGQQSFYWTDEEGTLQTVQFSNDTCKLTQVYSYDENEFSILGYETTLKFRKVWSA